MFADVEETRLPNGVRVVTSALPHVASVSFGIWVGVGARHESGGMSGASHFIEHLLFKGTTERSALDITRAIEGRGGYLNAFTQEEATCYYARVASEHTWEALEVLVDMYLNSLFDKAEIDKERQVIIEEMMMYRDQPQHLVQELLGDILWPRHPLGRPIIGNEKTISRMTREDLLDFKEKKYVSANTVFAFAGKLNHAECVENVADLVGKRSRRPPPRFTRVTSEVKQIKAVLRNKSIEQAHLAMGIRVFGRLDKRRYALKVLNTILGENMSSRLFQIVREKYGLAYSVHSSCHLFSDTGTLTISAGLDREKHLKAQQLILRELGRFRDRPVGARELRRAKDYVIGQLVLSLESTSNQMMWLGDNLLSHGRFMSPEKAMKAISAVAPEDIQALANRFFRRSRLSVAVVSAGIEEKGLREITDLACDF